MSRIATAEWPPKVNEFNLKKKKNNDDDDKNNNHKIGYKETNRSAIEKQKEGGRDWVTWISSSEYDQLKSRPWSEGGLWIRSSSCSEGICLSHGSDSDSDSDSDRCYCHDRYCLPPRHLLHHPSWGYYRFYHLKIPWKRKQNISCIRCAQKDETQRENK